MPTAGRTRRSLRETLLRGSAWIVAGKVVAAVTTLASNAILARILAPGVLGVYFVVTTTVLFGSVVAQLGSGPTSVRLIAEALATGQNARARAAVVAVLRLAGLGSIIVAGAFVLGLGRWLNDAVLRSPLFSGVIVLTAAWIVATTFNRAFTEIFRGFSAFHLAGLFDSLITNPFSLVAFLALWIADANPSVREVVAISVAATVVLVLIGAPLLRARMAKLKSAPWTSESELKWADVVRLTWPMFVTEISLFVLGSGVDIWILAGFRPPAEVAVYAAAVRLVVFLGMPLVVLNAVVQPVIAGMYARGEKDRLERALRGAATLVGIPSVSILLVFLLAGSPIMGLVFGAFYRRGATVLALLSAGLIANVLTGSCGVLLLMTGHHRTMMTITLTVAAATVTADLLLAGPFGAVGLAAATASGFVVQSLLMLLEAKRKVGIWTHAGVSLHEIRSLLFPAP